MQPTLIPADHSPSRGAAVPEESPEQFAQRMAMDKSGIYQIRNVCNGRVYIGSAVHIGNRFTRHRWELARGRHHSQKLQRAWDKHGAEAFEFKVLMQCAQGDLLMYEQILLDALDAVRSGYNVLPKAGSALGRKASAEERAKVSAAHKGRKHSPEFSEMRRVMQTGKSRTPETKAKIAASMSGRKLAPETIEKLRMRSVSPETRAKTSASVARIWADRKAAKEMLNA